jgi:pSer/pThr/pTyr-binding forkhead associated (FHA) protein
MPGLPPDEVYVARKLTIGRTPDNVFVIPEESVDRHHAMVEYRARGTPGASLSWPVFIRKAT